jgi:hypothetical protein
MLVRLTLKLAERLDGVDLSTRAVDEIFDLPPRDAELLIAERWAIPADEPPSMTQASTENPIRVEAVSAATVVVPGSNDPTHRGSIPGKVASLPSRQP